MAATSARLGGKSSATAFRNGPTKCSLVAMARPEMITLGGANSVMRLAMAKPKASPAAASRRTQRASPSAARRRPDHEVAEVRAQTVRAAKQFAIVQNAEPEASLDADDEKVVKLARLAEPMFRERDQIDVAVD